MLKEYPTYERGEVVEIHKKLKKEQKEIVKDYLQYRAGSCAPRKLEDIKRHVVSWHHIFEKDYDNINLKDIRDFLALLNNSKRELSVKNEIKTNLKNFLRWRFRDWSLKFDDLRDIKTRQGLNERKINSNTILKRENIEQIMKTENRIFWKTFFITLYETGFRPGELRNLRWDNIKFNVKGNISEISIYSTKTKKARVVYVKEATKFLQKLMDEQEKTGNKSEIVFHSPADKNKSLTKSSLTLWLNALSLKALGRKIHPYIVRHSRATELYRLAKQNKIAKDVAIDFMGHSEDMSKVYTHLNKEEIKQILTSVYNFEDIPKEKKHQLEREVELLKERMKELEKKRKSSDELINKLTSDPETLRIIAQAIAKLGLVGKVKEL